MYRLAAVVTLALSGLVAAKPLGTFNLTKPKWVSAYRYQLGATCVGWDDCDGDMICTGGLCSELSGTQTCSWAGHGIGTVPSAYTRDPKLRYF